MRPIKRQRIRSRFESRLRIDLIAKGFSQTLTSFDIFISNPKTGGYHITAYGTFFYSQEEDDHRRASRRDVIHSERLEVTLKNKTTCLDLVLIAKIANNVRTMCYCRMTLSCLNIVTTFLLQNMLDMDYICREAILLLVPSSLNGPYIMGMKLKVRYVV